MKETFVPALFEGPGGGVPERGVTRLPVKRAGSALPDPSQTAPENWTASCVITGHLVAALRGQAEFRTSDRSARLREGRTAVRRRGRRRGGGGSDGRTGGGPGLTRTSNCDERTKTGGPADIAAVRGQRDGAGGTGTARRPLSRGMGLEPPPDLPTRCDLAAGGRVLHRSRPLIAKKGGLRHGALRRAPLRCSGPGGQSLHPPSHVRDTTPFWSPVGCVCSDESSIIALSIKIEFDGNKILFYF